MTNYNDGKWHGWNGGECPVHPRSLVEISWQLKDGNITGSGMPDAAECWFWKGNGLGDIIAFRVTKEYKEPREFWIYPQCRDVLHQKPAFDAPHYIHVREVLE